MDDKYVGREEYESHVEDSVHGFRRLERLEAEVMGDELSGRNSLRKEFSEEQRKTRSAIIAAIIIMIIGFIIEVIITAPHHIANSMTP